MIINIKIIEIYVIKITFELAVRKLKNNIFNISLGMNHDGPESNNDCSPGKNTENNLLSLCIIVIIIIIIIILSSLFLILF